MKALNELCLLRHLCQLLFHCLYFSRALKATFVLIPLFGVQLAITIYRKEPLNQVAVHYERFTEIVINSQV
jgi:hypothetical protein